MKKMGFYDIAYYLLTGGIVVTFVLFFCEVTFGLGSGGKNWLIWLCIFAAEVIARKICGNKK